MDDLDQYDFDLPPEQIAQHPLPNRSDARLMLVDRSTRRVEHWHVRDLPDLLRGEDTLVLNNTRVIPARLAGFRDRTGGNWSGLFLSCSPDGLWQVMGKTRGKLEVGETVTLVDLSGQPSLQIQFVAGQGGGVWVVRPQTDESYLQSLDRVGRVPLPPYIRRGQMEPRDRESYQTVFAEHPGAVAAPTAGLHFTPALMRALEAKGLVFERITLHVGVGTFRPIKGSLAEHTMHTEWGRIEPSCVASLESRRASGGRTIAVGTTSLRVLETAARSGALRAWEGETDLFIRPPFEFHAAQGLLTNFHLPKSTLVVLVRTFGGDELLKEAYREAVEQEYRFFSYGDAMLIL